MFKRHQIGMLLWNTINNAEQHSNIGFFDDFRKQTYFNATSLFQKERKKGRWLKNLHTEIIVVSYSHVNA